MLDIIKSFLKDNWVFKYKPSTKNIKAYHPRDSIQPVCEIKLVAGADEFGLALAKFLNTPPKGFLIDDNIDWALLREQKQYLVEVISPHYGDEHTEADQLSGILHLIDGIQDGAVESGKWTEKEIFG
jgi:hypothetical protein